MFGLFFCVFYLFCVCGFFLGSDGDCLLVEFMLGELFGSSFSFSLIFDYISLGFFGVVSYISFLVFFYSGFYMSGTISMRRFVFLVFGFVISMCFLVFSGNFFFVLLGWDGLGVISFCLVIFYHNSGSLESGLLTVFSNRLGDVFFLGSFLFFFMMGTLGGGVILCGSYLFCIFIFLGAITKSAQFPFSAWLPAAMAAPTPVSSLVHSSTLVTAGVYVLIRFFGVFFYDVFFMKVFFLGTMILAGGCAVFEADFKKVVAMSTLSQLGFMLFVLSFGGWVMVFLHVITHAIFKSMLFLSVGSLMSVYEGGQDSRFYGNSMNWVSFLLFCVSCICLSGFPFFIGFYSKDFILLSGDLFLGVSLYFGFLFGCVMTVFYSLRLVFSGFGEFCKWGGFWGEANNFGFSFWVIFLFLKSWIGGGLLWWIFLCETEIFFGGFDLLLGLFLLLLGGFYFLGVGLNESISWFFSEIGFLRWFSTGSSSVFFFKMRVRNWDFGWFEYFGPQGVYGGALAGSVLFDLWGVLTLGVLFIFFVWMFVFVF